MKLVWSPDRASKAYIDTVKSCEISGEFGVAELLSAMAAGWNAKVIVETWSEGGPVATSVGLAIAAGHTGGRHVCVVADERARSKYVEAMREAGVAAAPEVEIGEAAAAVARAEGVDFLVADCRRRDFGRVLRLVRTSERGAVLVCKNAWERDGSGFRWQRVLQRGTRVVKSVFLPVGRGLEIAHIGSRSLGGGGGGSGSSDSTAKGGRWIRRVDKLSGEEHVFRE